MSKRSDSNSTLFRALLIMEKIVEAERPVSSAYLAEMLELPKPTVHRIAQQLEGEGYLQREPVSRRFVAGRRLRDFSLAVLSNSVLGAPRHAVLQALEEKFAPGCTPPLPSPPPASDTVAPACPRPGRPSPTFLCSVRVRKKAFPHLTLSRGRKRVKG